VIGGLRRETIDVRPYREDDEPGVLALLGDSFEGTPIGPWSSSFFRWKHLSNPFGRSLILVARAQGRIIGLRAFMRWRFHAGDRMLEAVRAVDTATHPDFQGRGVFSRLTLDALDALGNGVDLVFNTPNDKSRPGYLKMGWRVVGTVPVLIRVRRPVRFAKGVRSLDERTAPRGTPPPVDAETALQALGDEEALTGLLADQGDDDRRLRTPRDTTYLRWRYGSPQGLDYRAVRQFDGGRLRGLAIFRIRPRGVLWETTVAETIVGGQDRRVSRRLLREVVAAAPVDHVAAHAPAGSAAAAAMRRTGFLPAPKGITLTVNMRRENVDPNPTDLRNWALSLGDLEVF
jgi:GNAT superfamily N-acetyltransferase